MLPMTILWIRLNLVVTILGLSLSILPCCRQRGGVYGLSTPKGGAPVPNKAWKQWPPHSGYHGRGANTNNAFFEGWYLRVITQKQGSIALIFHIFDPHLPPDGSSSSSSSSRRGVGMQAITPLGTVRIESSDLSTFQAASHKLDIRNYFHYPNSHGNNNNDKSRVRDEAGKDFFRLNTDRASGGISSSGSDWIIDYDFAIEPQVGWGTSERQYSVAGFLAAFPVFEPHYQVLLSRGHCPRGYFSMRPKDKNNVDSGGMVYDLTNATIYLEKNWGGRFPSKWWWIQAHTFTKVSTEKVISERRSSTLPVLDLCVTSTGGKRRIPFLPTFQQQDDDEEDVALIALHWDGKFLPFPNVEWIVSWGQWTVKGSYGKYVVELEGTCSNPTDKGVPVNCPTLQGMEEIALETFKGTLRVKLFERRQNDDTKLTLILDAVDEQQACLEIGGLPWTERIWYGQSAMKEPLKSIAMNVELERRASDLLQLVSWFVEIPGL